MKSSRAGRMLCRRRPSEARRRVTTGRGAAVYPLLSVPAASTPCESELVMNLSLSIGPLVSLIAGILILVMPRLLNFIVAIYLIVIGLLGLFGGGSFKLA